MDLDVVTQYIISITPAITAIVGAVAACIVAIKNVKAEGKKIVETVDLKMTPAAKIMKENEQLKAENIELRRINVRLQNKICDVREEE